MTPEEARLELDATTLRPQDASEEARALMDRDKELAQWREKRRNFDEDMADLFAEMPVPAMLPKLILQDQAKSVAAQRRKPIFLSFGLLAAAAALLVASLWFINDATPAWEKDSLAMLEKIEGGKMPLDAFSSDLDHLKGVLAKAETPVPQSLPSAMDAFKSLGCKSFKAGGWLASIVCFEVAPGQEAHLVVVDHAEKLQLVNRKVFAAQGEWQTATWSDGQQTYLLATRAKGVDLEKLLAQNKQINEPKAIS
jgi:hypothetical protein